MVVGFSRRIAQRAADVLGLWACGLWEGPGRSAAQSNRAQAREARAVVAGYAGLEPRASELGPERI